MCKKPFSRLSNQVYYEVVSHCNLGCIHCLDSFRVSQRELDPRDLMPFHWLLARLGVTRSVVTGGEPTLHDELEVLLTCLQETGPVVVTTNGTAQPPDYFLSLLDGNPGVFLQISFDGMSETTFDAVRGRGMFTRVVDLIDRLTAAGLAGRLGLSMTLMAANVDEVKDLLTFAGDRGIASVHFPQLVPAGYARERWSEVAAPADQLVAAEEFLLDRMVRDDGPPHISVNRLERVLVKMMEGEAGGCLNTLTLKVRPDGQVLPCPAAGDEASSLGHISEFDTPGDLLHRIEGRIASVRNASRRLMPECADCAVFATCRSELCEACGLLGPRRPQIVAHGCRVMIHHATRAQQAAEDEADVEGVAAADIPAATEAQAPRPIEVIVPLYISNHCDGTCAVCSNRRTNSELERRRAGEDEILEQLHIIFDVERIWAVNFVSGELLPGPARRRNLDVVCSSAAAAFAMGFDKVSVNIGALSEDEIAILSSRFPGEERLSMAIFQETFDREAYRRLLGSDPAISPKADFDHRLGAPLRWLDGGFTQMNLGVLLGLAPPQPDVDALIEYCNRLHDQGADIAISLPRLRGLQRHPYPVSDDLFRDLVQKVAEACPWSKVVMSTRESLELIRELLPWTTVVSPGSSDILPYTASGPIHNRRASSQFQVAPMRPRPSWVLEALQLPPGAVRYFENRPDAVSKGAPDTGRARQVCV